MAFSDKARAIMPYFRWNNDSESAWGSATTDDGVVVSISVGPRKVGVCASYWRKPGPDLGPIFINADTVHEALRRLEGAVIGGGSPWPRKGRKLYDFKGDLFETLEEAAEAIEKLPPKKRLGTIKEYVLVETGEEWESD